MAKKAYKIFQDEGSGEWVCEFPGPKGNSGEMPLKVFDQARAMSEVSRIFRVGWDQIETPLDREIHRRECAEAIARVTGDRSN